MAIDVDFFSSRCVIVSVSRLGSIQLGVSSSIIIPTKKVVTKASTRPMAKRGIVEALPPGLKDWRSILEAFRTHDVVSEIFRDRRDIAEYKGFIVGRETFKDPYADCSLVSELLYDFWKKEKYRLNAAGTPQESPDVRDWTVTLICARLFSISQRLETMDT